MAEEYRKKHGMAAINLITFAKIAMPAYNAALKAETILNDFRKAGLYLWNVDAVDFSRCRAADIQSQCPDPLVGVNIGGTYDFDTLIVYN